MSKKINAALVAAALSADPADRILIDSGAGYAGGQVLFANDSRFAETFFSQPLTTYSVGWRDPNNLEDTLAFMAPEVPVSRRFEWKRAENAEEFLSETFDDQRAIGADFKKVEYTGTMVNDKTLNKGLTLIVDLDNVAPGDPWEQKAVAKLQRRLLRNEVRRAFAALSGAATNTAKTWGSSADPDSDVRADLITATDATGIRPNRVLYGDTSFNLRLTAFRAQNNAGSNASAGMTPEQIAASLMVDRILVSKERYQSGAAAKTQITGNKVIMFYADDMADVEDPSNIKRFVTPFSGDQGGGRIRVYRQQLNAKLVAITVEHYSKIVVTYSSGIRQFTVS
jgi:hypothetical protein